MAEPSDSAQINPGVAPSLQTGSPYSSKTAGVSSRSVGSASANISKLSQEDQIAEELATLRAQNVFGDLAESFPEGGAPRRLVESLSRSFGLQLLVFCLGYLGAALSFRILVGGATETLQGLNFFLFLYLLGAAVYFGRYGMRGALASLMLLVLAIVCYALKLTGFRPSIFFLVTHPLVALASATTLTPLLETAATKTVMANSVRNQLLALEARQRSGGQQDDGVLERMKEAEVKTVRLRTQFSDLLNNLRDLGGAYRESDIYSTLFRLLRKGVDAEMADIWFLNEEGTYFQSQEARVAGGADMVVTDFSARIPHDSTSILSYCARQERAILPAEIARDPTLGRLKTQGAHPTCACFPILTEGKVRAVVNISKGPAELDAQQIALLNTISQIVSKAFESAATFRLSENERAAAVNMGEQERAERIKTRETLERFVSKNVVDEVMANPKLSQNMETTILLADLRGFTTISERLEPEVIVDLLNDYFGVLTPLIFDHGGTLDKYIGDMVMALFGPPRPTGHDAISAVRCALEMRRAFDRTFRTKWEPIVGCTLEMGIALNTGPATVGLLGSERLVNYTAIGDSVNTASRLEDVTPGGRILLTESTYAKVSSIADAHPVGAKSFKGKTEKTRIYDLRGLLAQAGRVPDQSFSEDISVQSIPAPQIAPQPAAARRAAAAPPAPPTGQAPPPRQPAAPAAPAPGLAPPMHDAAPQRPRPAPAAAAPRPPPPAPAASTAPCPLCQSPVPPGSQACPTCGMKL